MILIILRDCFTDLMLILIIFFSLLSYSNSQNEARNSKQNPIA